jgi:glycerophosphoryl diester phosphodiesterase
MRTFRFSQRAARRRVLAIASASAVIAAFGVGGMAEVIAGQTPKAGTPTTGSTKAGEPKRPWIVGHRGASAYAPENTIPALLLAAEQGATYVEYDLQPSKDGVLVLLHDETLERTTNVAEVYPQRFREVKGADGAMVKRWYLLDFTFAELQKLDAGAWFDAKFKGTKLPSHAEAIAATKGKVGLFIELKSPEKYRPKGFDIEGVTLADLKKAGLDQPYVDAKTPVLIQSFDQESVEILTNKLKTKLPVHFLYANRDTAKWSTAAGMKQIRGFATGVSPEKIVLINNPKAAELARAAGLAVTPWTYRATTVKGYADVSAEMAHDLKTYQLDGLITDNPDKAPK